MPTSSSDPRITLQALDPYTELTVVDAGFRTVAYGVGSLDVTVAPGVYELRYRAGPAAQERLVVLGPGDAIADRRVEVGLPTAAPVAFSGTSREFHQHTTWLRSSALGDAESAGVVVMIRDLAGGERLPLDHAAVSATVVADAHGAPLHPTSAWKFDDREDLATLTLPCQPGGLVLRTPGTDAGSGAVEQSLWLGEGWQALVFVANTSAGPAFGAASVHVAAVGEPWHAGRLGVDGSAIETALWGLRERRSVAPEQLLEQITRRASENPMLGIVGAYSLLLGADPPLTAIGDVLGQIENAMPGHPDVVALDWMIEERRARAEGVAPDPERRREAPPVDWPPMVRPGYAALVRLDALAPGAIAEGSAAQGVGEGLVNHGVWTSWRAVPLAAPRFGSCAAEQVERYVAARASAVGSVPSDVLDTADEQQVAVATGLPRATVRRALRELEQLREEA